MLKKLHLFLVMASIKYAKQQRGFINSKDLKDSEDPKHTLFCRETAFVVIYGLLRGNILIL